MTAVTMAEKRGAAATNQSPPNSSRYNKARTAGGCRCMHECVFPLLSGRREGGTNTQEIRDLLIIIFSHSNCFPRPLSSLGLPFSTSLFITGCGGLHFLAQQFETDSVSSLLLRHLFSLGKVQDSIQEVISYHLRFVFNNL